ncbi:unnamed protein product, partial [Mesorhabditis belari]|uniref:Uncharacterized protein n=1 Tax=Mesorhabditis belari TaxID=2138241 RepID=A0AAF3F905_9BILA
MFASTKNAAKNSKPLELLFIGCQSSDPYSVMSINPWTGISSWTYKGTELQNGTVGSAKPIGVDGKHFLVNVNERPIIHIKGLHPKDRYHSMAYLPEPATTFVTSKDGLLLFVAIKTRVYVWMLTSGYLVASFDAHYQSISDMAISNDSSLLITASLDGSIHVYLVADIVNLDRQSTIYPVRKTKAHSLAISSIAVSCGGSPRILSVGMDHVAFLHSISMDACLLKISAERPLTACAIDKAETRVFLGTDRGRIAQVNLYDIKFSFKPLATMTQFQYLLVIRVKSQYELCVVNGRVVDDQPKWCKISKECIDDTLKNLDPNSELETNDSQMHSLFEDGGDDEVERLRREVVRLQRANQGLYNFSVNLVLNRNNDDTEDEEKSEEKFLEHLLLSCCC